MLLLLRPASKTWRSALSALRLAFVIVLCIFSTADDLTDIFLGALGRFSVNPSQVRTCNSAEDDHEDNHGIRGAEYGSFVVTADYSSAVFNERVSETPALRVTARPVLAAAGRAPPAAV